MSDKPSRPMSPSSMARLAARSRAPRRTGSRRGVTSSSWAPRARVGEPGSGRDSPPPPLQTQDAQLYSWGAKLGSLGRAPCHSSPSALWAGGSQAGLLPPADYLRAPPSPRPEQRNSPQPVTRHPHGASSERPGRRGLTAAALPSLPPASPPRARLHQPQAGVLSVGQAGGAAGKDPRWGRGRVTQPQGTERMAQRGRPRGHPVPGSERVRSSPLPPAAGP